MNFDLSDEQRMLQETLRQFLEAECPPGRIRELLDAEDAFDPALWKGLVEMGVAGIHLPEEYGGAGLEILDLAVAAETLGHEAAPGPFLGHSLGSLAIALAGSDEQKQRWLPGLATGDLLATFAFCEGDAEWDPSEWKLDGSDSLTGTKKLVPFAQASDLIVVGVAGGGLVVVKRDAAGLEVETLDAADGTRRLDNLSFENTPCEPLPGGETASQRVRDVGLVLLAADAFGGASRCVEMAVEYAKNREQFGVTIGHFQALKHQLANMAIETEPTRGLYWFAAHALDHVQDEAERSAAIAKAHITDRFMQVARDTVEAHGGIGFTWECDVQIWFKRAMFDRALMGNPSIHRERAAQLADW